jgi:hypothetical protein
VDATLSIRNTGLSRATALDANGMATGSVAVSQRNDALVVTLPPDALYVVID